MLPVSSAVICISTAAVQRRTHAANVHVAWDTFVGCIDSCAAVCERTSEHLTAVCRSDLCNNHTELFSAK